MDVELGVAGRVVEDLVEDESEGGEDDAEIVAPAPAGGCFEDEEAGDDGAEDGEGEGAEEDECDDGTSLFVGDEFSEDDSE